MIRLFNIIFILSLLCASYTKAASVNGYDKIVLEAMNSINAGRTQCVLQEVEGLELLKLARACKLVIDKHYVSEVYDESLLYAKYLLDLGIDEDHADIFRQLIDTKEEWVVDKLHYLLAKYYFKSNNPDKVISNLRKISDSLDENEVYHSLLLYGISYFNKGVYRQAQRYLSRVPQKSSYYAQAQFNIALMYMRRQWWQDAEYAMKDILSVKSKIQIDPITLNKIYITYGYSLLQRSNYRNAIKIFKQVTKDSIYSNRALFGISMAEIGLGDYEQAAGYTQYVVDRNIYDQAYLDAVVLLPEIYTKAGNSKIATELYIKGLSFIENKYKDPAEIQKFMNTANVSISTVRLNILKNRLKILSDIKNRINNTSQVDDKILTIKNKINAMKLRFVNSKRKMMLDYINQMKYAYAVIMDNHVSYKQ